jgi:sodium/bile acid cotransporter 7
MPRRWPLDPFITALLCTVALASLLPASGAGATAVSDLGKIAVALLFFIYGARLSAREALDGLRVWRLHGTVFLTTFAVFPRVGLGCRFLVPWLLTPQLYQGVLFLCLLPSTVQSSIAFTSIARGNVAAAVCSATFSSLFGIVLTPLLAAALLSVDGTGGISAGSMTGIVLQLLVPFLIGQFARRWIHGWMTRHKKALTLVDRGSIVIVVYGAFSEGVTGGIWGMLSLPRLLGLLLVCTAVLAVLLAVTQAGAKRLGFDREDRITVVFCGSKKSLASGVPMASVLFPGPMAGLMVLPLMLFHQIQLMVCAYLARRWAAQRAERGIPMVERPREYARV